MRPLTLAVLYEQLGLDPLDEFIESAVGRNQLDGTGDDFRQIGSSTWCALEALLNLLRGYNSVLSDLDYDRSQHLWRSALRWATELEMRVVSTEPSSRGTRAKFRVHPLNCDRAISVLMQSTTMPVNAVSTTVIQNLTMENALKTHLYRDEVYKDMAVSRFRGPFDMIFEVRSIWYGGKSRHAAFDRRGEYILELTEDGFASFEQERSGAFRHQRITVGHEQISRNGSIREIYKKLGLPPSFLNTPSTP